MFLDIIFILIVVFFVFLGWKRGLMLSAFSLASTFVALIIAIIFTPAASSWLQNTDTVKDMKTSFSSYIETKLDESVGEMTKTEIDKTIRELPLPEFVTDKLSAGAAEFTDDLSEESFADFSQKIGNDAAKIACGLVGFVIVFIIIKIALFIAKYVLKITSQIPVIHQIDKIGGIAIGFAEGVFCVMVLLLLVSFFSSMPQMQGLLDAVNNSHLTKYAYENNLIGEIISKML